MASVLDHIRVAAFTHFAAGPIAAQYLGSFGADVVKIEAPQQDVNRYALRHPEGLLQGISPYFLVTNRNQRGLGLDLKKPDGAAIAKRLVARADVLLENYRPGVMERLGLGYEAVRQINPRIIYCSLSAYDFAGPRRDSPGQDLLLQALSGLASLTGHGDGPPVPVGAYIIDGFTAMQAVAGVLAALRHRDSTGLGQWIRADMMSATLYMLAQEASYVLNVDPNPQRSRAGIAHVNQSAPYGIYRTADGAVAISTFGGVATVRRLAEALGIVDSENRLLSERGLRFERDRAAHLFAKAIERKSTAEVIRLVEPTGAWAAPVRTLKEALDDPAVAASGIIKEIETDYGGRYRVVLEPLKMSETPLVSDRPAPAHGEHSEEILSELGFSPSDIEQYFKNGAAFCSHRPRVELS